jgi:RNA polymerase sigma-70 factor (ECF subfamily)
MAESSEDVDRQLADARAGSAEALGRAFEACRRYLLLVAGRRLDPDLQAKGGASDLVQETFLEAQRDFGRFDGTSEPELRAWLRRILINNAGTFTRRYRATGKRAVDLEMRLGARGSSLDPGAGLAGSTPSPSGQAIDQEQALALQRALARLPEDYRRAVTLRFQEGLSFEEIGRRMDRTAEAARKLWSRAMERLRDEWEGEHD